MMHKTITVFGKQIPVWALAAAAGALGLVLVMRARSKGTSVVSAGTTAAAASAAQAAAAATTYDPNLQGLVSGSPYAGTADYGSEMAYIQAQLNALANPPASSTTPGTAPDVGAFSGGSYGPAAGTGGYETAGTSTYEWLTSMSQVDQIVAAGGKVYVQPQPGVFTVMDPKTYGGGAIWATTPYTGPHPAAGAAATAQVNQHVSPAPPGTTPFLSNAGGTPQPSSSPVAMYGTIAPAQGLTAPALGIHA